MTGTIPPNIRKWSTNRLGQMAPPSPIHAQHLAKCSNGQIPFRTNHGTRTICTHRKNPLPCTRNRFQTRPDQSHEASCAAGDNACPTDNDQGNQVQTLWRRTESLAGGDPPENDAPYGQTWPQEIRPQEITKKLSHVVYQLRILQQWKIHDVFHAALLTPYKETKEHGSNYHEPPPDVIEGKLKWEVEQIMGARRFGHSRRLQYRVRWTGYSDVHDTWETADDVHAPQLTADFWKGNQALAKQIAYKPAPP